MINKKTSSLVFLSAFAFIFALSANGSRAQDASTCASIGGTCRTQGEHGAKTCQTSETDYGTRGCQSGTTCCVNPNKSNCETDCKSKGLTGSALLQCRDECQKSNPGTGSAQCCVDSQNKSCTAIPSNVSEESCKSSGGTISSSSCSSLPACSKSGGSGSGNTSGGGGSSGSGSANFANPIGVSNISEFLNKVLTNLKGLVITIAVIFMILGALMYMMSGGNQTMITRAKSCVGGAIIGLALALAAPTFLKTIIDVFGGAKGLSTNGLEGPTLTTVATNVLSLLLSLFGIIAIISLVVGGSMYLTAYGDQKKIDTAKTTVKYSIIGIIIALGAIVIARQIAKLLGAA